MIKRAMAMVSLAVALVGPWHQAQAQAMGSTAISINFPNIVILNYFSDLTLNFTGGVISDADSDEGSASPSADLDTTASFDANVDGSTGGPTIPGTVAVTISNAWAIRGISTDGTITVAAAWDNDTASNGSSDAVGGALTVETGALSGASIDVPAPGFSTPTKGDVVFDLDISGVTTAQTHTGMQYTITASAP